MSSLYCKIQKVLFERKQQNHISKPKKNVLVIQNDNDE